MAEAGKRIKEYTASAINTGGAVYKKIMANEHPEREKQGAIEKALNDLFDFLDAYREKDVFNQQGSHRLKSLNFFSGLTKTKSESLISLTNKYKAMMIRNEEYLDTVWGTKWNIEHALRYFFYNPSCFVMEFTNDQKTNCLTDQFTDEAWTVDGKHIEKDSPFFSQEAALVNIQGIDLTNNGTLYTRKPVRLSEGLYSFHFFMRSKKETASDGTPIPSLQVTIKNGTGKTVFDKKYAGISSWRNVQEYIQLPEDDYTFTFTRILDGFLAFDFPCLYPAVPYPSLSIVIGNGGSFGRNFLFFAPGKKDVDLKADGTVEKYYEPPYEGTHDKYKFWFPHADDTEKEAKEDRKKKGLKFDDRHFGYFSDDLSFLVDVNYINTLLDCLIPAGVKVFDIIVSRRGV